MIRGFTAWKWNPFLSIVKENREIPATTWDMASVQKWYILPEVPVGMFHSHINCSDSYSELNNMTMWVSVSFTSG